MICYLSCLVDNILEIFKFDDFLSSSTGGLEILRFTVCIVLLLPWCAVCIDPLMLQFAVYIDIFKQQFTNCCLIGSM